MGIGLLLRYRSVWCASLLCLLLAACATPQRIVHNGNTDVFDRTGRFALTSSDASGKQDAVQGGFAWSDNGATLRLDLANPLGTTLARVQVTPGHATMTRANGSREEATDPDALVALVLGSPVPVAGLRDWLQGRTGDLPTNRLERDSEGRVASFEQNGWRVALSRYDALGPQLLRLVRDDAGRHVSMRLVVDGG